MVEPRDQATNPIPGPGMSAEPGEVPGMRLGPYRLLERLGEGGFGTVFLAEQEAPVRRQVAIKIVKLGMDTRQVIARFEQERQALALMDHPNIARVLDGGATATGRPYFVMDLVRGIPITEYCDRNKLSPRERLELLVPVCDAIQHAHQKGIIHRDIKPSNILVTDLEGRAVPKVIDFGLAKATGPRLTEKTILTEQRQVIGTPAYMSPEQFKSNGLDIDTRTDLYALGVLLYELLTGTTPVDARQLLDVGLGEIQHLICEVEPLRPSLRVSSSGDKGASVAAQRRTEPRRLRTLIRGDLDWIVLKALEKDRTRRYATAGDLAADVLRHLRGEPVQAAPPSATYRLRKFVRRRRGLVAAVIAVLLAVVGGIVGTGIALLQARRAYEGEMLARGAEAKQRQRAEKTAAFLRDMFESIDPERARGEEVTVKSRLDDAAAKLVALADEPEVEAALHHTLAETYSQLGLFRESKAQFELAAEIRALVLGPQHRDTLSDRFGVGQALLRLGEIDAAVLLLRETCDVQSGALGARDGDTLQTRSVLAYAKQLSGDAEAALAAYREVLVDQAAVLGPGHRTALDTLSSVADVLQDLGRLAEAEQAARQLVSVAGEVQGAEGPQTLTGKSILASVLNDLGRYQEAEPLGREVLAARQRIYGANHALTLLTASVLATSLEKQDKFDEAFRLLQHAANASTASLGGEHATTLTYLGNLARIEQLRGRFDEAERILRQVLDARRRVSGEEATATLSVMNNLGLLLVDRGKPGEAETILRRVESAVQRGLPEDHWMRGQAKVNLGRSLARQAKYAEAEAAFQAGYELLVKSLPAGHSRRKLAASALADLYRSWGKPDAEAEWRARK